MEEVNIIYKDLAPDYIPFVVQFTAKDTSKTDPSHYGLEVYEEDCVDQNFSSEEAEIGSIFDDIFSDTFGRNPEKVNSKSGLYGILIDKTYFTNNKTYRFIWQATVDSVQTSKEELYVFHSASDFKE